MNRNPVTAALDHVDAEPSNEFLGTLRAQLLADLDEPDETSNTVSRRRVESSPERIEDCIVLTPVQSRVGLDRRVPKILLAAAACITMFATAALIANRPNNDLTVGVLNDVDPREAAPLARAASITADALGSRWKQEDVFSESLYAAEAAATIAALPDCALLASVGLFPPTSKSVSVHQFFTPGTRFVGHTVFVFATAEDASRAMDVIGGDLYRTCWFSFYDRLMPRGATMGIETLTSAPWAAPAIVAHGDRQIIIGQRSDFTNGNSPSSFDFINAYVQVGRAISWINPPYNAKADQPLFVANNAIDATTAALERVFVD